MPAPSFVRLLFSTLLRHRYLIAEFTRREIQSRYRGASLGLLWSVLNPILQLAIFTFVFGVVFGARWPQAKTTRLGEFATTLFCGLLVMNVINDAVGRAPGLIVASPNYVKRVVFPLEVLPVVVVCSSLFTAAAGLAVLLVAHLLQGGSLHWTLLFVPAVALPLALLALGASWFLASFGVFMRDLGQVVGLALQALLFLTPVLYPVEALPSAYRPLLQLNPLSLIVEDMRRVVLWGSAPAWWGWALVTAAGLGFSVLGFVWFMRTKRAFADVV